MLESLLPAGVVVAEAFDDPSGLELYPQEAALIANAVESRRREFTTVRHCARRALAELGLPAGPVLPGPHGAPRWPDQVVGSLTHCTGYRGAALALGSRIALLGIDAEPAGPLPKGVLESIALAGELRRVADQLAVAPQLPWDRILFSAKEAVYKAWYPRTGQRLEFEDADIRIDPQNGTFTADLLAPAPVSPAGPPLPRRLHGGWLVRDALVLTAIAMPVLVPGPV